jgi:hypothetical protein
MGGTRWKEKGEAHIDDYQGRGRVQGALEVARAGLVHRPGEISLAV